MYMNENNQYTEEAEFFWNEYIEMYCVIGTTISNPDIDFIYSCFESPDLLKEVPMPKYIKSENYDEATW